MKVANMMYSQMVWRPMGDTDKDGATGDLFYQGQLLMNGSDGSTATHPWPDGVSPAKDASGAADTTDEMVLCGIIQGFNPRIRTLDSTYGVHRSAGVSSSSDQVARNIGPYGGHEVYADPAPKLQMATIMPWTQIQIQIYNSTINTTISLLTSTAVSGTNVSATVNAVDFTPVANLATIYCRSGANQGIYRQMTGTSTTALTWDKAFSRTMVIGDTFVAAPCRLGPSWIQLDTEGIFMDGSATAGTDYYIFHVDELHFDVPGKEHVVGRFDPVHFGRRA